MILYLPLTQVEIWKGGVFITTLKEGSLLGEMSLLLNQTERTATVKAVDGVQLLAISGADISQESGARLRPLAEMATKRLSILISLCLSVCAGIMRSLAFRFINLGSADRAVAFSLQSHFRRSNRNDHLSEQGSARI